MRLQLCIQRQGLPPVQVLWNAGGIRPNHGADGTTTIAQLLEQINEVMPLEAEDWGLEDYCVEVDGFECLHFVVLDQILKDDDKVSIRPLQTTDLRYRRISGRHQISSDGKHLIDGVAFGRPFLRRADRPAIRIPPRKRIRFSLDDDNESENGQRPYNSQRALVTSEGNHADEIAGDGGDEDEYELTEDDHERLASELKDLKEDLQEFGDATQDVKMSAVFNGAHKSPARRMRSQKRHRIEGLGLRGDDIFEDETRNGEGILAGYHNPLLDHYYQDEPTGSSTKRAKTRRINPSTSRALTNSHQKSPAEQRISRRSSSASTKSVHFEGEELETPATIREDDDEDESDDEDFQPDDEDMSDQVESDKENIEPETVARLSAQNFQAPSEVDLLTTSSEDLNLSTEASSDDDSDSSDTSSSYTSSSGSSSSSGDKLVSDKQENLKTKETKFKDTVVIADDSTKERRMSILPTPPYQGMRKTKKRNERRRIHNKLNGLKRAGLLSPNATIADYNKLTESRDVNGQPTLADTSREPEVKDKEHTAVFEEKRKALLESISSGGVDLTTDTAKSPSQKMAIRTGVNYHSVDMADKPTEGRSASVPATSLPENDGTPKSIQIGPEAVSTSSEPPRRRAKLDLASSKRLLFGSLGLRTPKTKTDELKLREKLMENVRSGAQSSAQKEKSKKEQSAITPTDEDDTWKSKIILKAVECCHDDIELSTPPFPFVQRWDPQQQGQSYTRGGAPNESRGKKRKRNNKKYQQQEKDQVESYFASNAEPEHIASTNDLAVDAGVSGRSSDQRRADSDEYQGAIDKQILQDTAALAADPAASADELPTLPEDISVLAALVPEAAKSGTIIAFKQLDMSQETNWQPKISGYRTAKIDNVLDNGQLEMTLAYRDRPNKGKLYDEKTGERLYSKFEMPEFDAGDGSDDDGFLELGIAEMIEPKLIRIAISSSAIAAEGGQHSTIIPPEVETVDMSAISDGDRAIYDAEDVDNGDRSAKVVVTEELTSFETLKESSQHPQEPIEITEENRLEISMLIKDAGFRTNLHSDIDQGLEEKAMQKDTTAAHPPGELAQDTLSPRFNGFSSNPSEQPSSKQADAEESYHEAEDQIPSSQPQTKGTNTSNISYPHLRNPSPRAEPQPEPEIEDSWPPPKIVDEDEDLFADDSFPPPVEPPDDPEEDPDFEVDSSRYSSQMRASRPATRRSMRGRGENSKTGYVFSDKEVSEGGGEEVDEDDDEDFPTVNAMFSTARSRVLEEDEDEDEVRHRRTTRSSFSASQLKSKPKTRKRQSSSLDDVMASSSQSSAGEHDIAMGSSGRQRHGGEESQSTQVVDLTLESDGLEGSGREDESNAGLPSGPGWVRKRKMKARRGKPPGGRRQFPRYV